MNDLDPRLRHLFWFVAELFAALVSALALLLIIARLALPHADVFKPHIEAWFSQALGETVRIGAVNAHWPGLDLTVVLDDVALLDSSGQSRAEFDRAFVSLDPLASLLDGVPRLSELHIDGLEVSLFGDVFAATADPAPPLPDVQSATATDDFGWFLPWLLGQRLVEVTSGQLLWHDPTTDQAQLNGFSLRARNVGGRHTLAVHLDTRAGDGAIDLAAELDGAAGSPEAWRGSLYLRGQRVLWRGVALLAEQAFPGSTANLMPLDAELGLPGITDFELWGELRGGQVQHITGEAAVSTPGEAQLLGIERIATRFDWHPEDNGWELAIDGVEVEPVGGGRFRTGPAGVRYASEEGVPVVEAGLASIDVGILQQLALAGGWLSEERAAQVDALAPRGQLYDLRGRWQGASGDRVADWRLVGELWDLRLDAWKKWPGIQGLRVEFDVGPEGGLGTLFGRNTVVTLPWLFREPLEGDRVAGQVRVSREAAGWRLHSEALELDNAHIRTVTRLDAILPDAGGAPFVDLEVGYRDGDASEAWRYLPVGIMSDEVVAWLDHALVSGRVVEGGMLLHGALDRFPFDDHDGRFQVRFLVDGMTLDYLEGWPRIDGLGAWTTFDGRGMHIEAHEGRILGAALGPTVAVAPDLTAEPAMLRIDGSVSGDAGAGLRYLRESPLRERFGDYLAVADASGRLDLGLDLDIELDSGDTGVDGTIDLADTILDLPDFGIRVEKGRGRLAFDNDSLVGRGLTADWHGMSAEVDVQVPDDPGAGRRGPRITARGRAGEAQFAAFLPPATASRLVGELAWETVVGVRESEDGHVDEVSIRSTSDLEGLEIVLPPPLGKTASEHKPLLLEARLPGDGNPLLEVAYGALSLVAELEPSDAGLRVPRAALGIGSGPATLPDTPVWRADLRGERLFLDEWRAVAAEFEGHAEPTAAAPPMQIDARFGSVPLGEEAVLHEVEARIAGDSDAWRIALASREASGTIEVPRLVGRDRPVEARFERVTVDYSLESPEDAAPAAEPEPVPTGPDPRTLPGMNLTIDNLVVNDRDFGTLNLQASPVDEGLRVSRIVLDHPEWIVTGSGRWEMGVDRSTTSLDLALDSTNFNRLASALYGEAGVDVRETHFNANLGWSGAPHHMSMAGLVGTLRGRMLDGVLTEVNPGAGRLLSLVNLRTLGRRLTLDFSDLVEEGMSFDSISGSFVFASGDAFTNDLLIESTLGTINIMGRTGLVARDYDQVMTVLPRVSGALPIAGTLLAGPVVGAALLLFNEVFAEELGKVAAAQYRITGPWEAPEIERITSEAEQGDAPPDTENR